MKLATVTEFGPTWDPPGDGYALALSITINGEPGRKSNARRIVRNRNTGKPMIIKSQKALNYKEAFIAQVPEDYQAHLGGPEHPLALWAHLYYASNRPDISSELIQDLLQEAGVVTNDRWIKQVFLFGAIDRENPRAELRIYHIL